MKKHTGLFLERHIRPNTSEAVTRRKVDNLFKGEIFKSISRGLNITTFRSYQH